MILAIFGNVSSIPELFVNINWSIYGGALFFVLLLINFVDDKIVWELKTVSYLPPYRYKIPTKHIAQLNLYLWLNDKKYGKLVYIDKRNLNTIEHSFEFDAKLFRTTIDIFCDVYNHLIMNTLPPAEPIDESECGYCAFRLECTNDEV